jgi:signal transduction histidine kinase
VNTDFVLALSDGVAAASTGGPQLVTSDSHATAAVLEPGGATAAAVSADHPEGAPRARVTFEAQQHRLRALLAALVVAEESERRATATELHDEIGQALAGVKLKLDALEQDLAAGPAADAVRDVSRLVSRIIGRARALMAELSPPGIYDLDFEMALDWLARRAFERDGIVCALEVTGVSAVLAPELRVMLFAAARELLRNVAEHSSVREATLRIAYAPARVELEVEDGGRGFDTNTLACLPSATEGFGLFGMTERVRDFGGDVAVVSAPGRGTRVRLSLPLDPAAGAA